MSFPGRNNAKIYNQPSGGGNKLQGLAPTTNKPVSAIRSINMYAWGPSGWRKHIVCMNQLGGIGKGRSQFGPSADGLTAECLAEASPGQSMADYLDEIYNYLLGSSEIPKVIKDTNLSIYNISNNFELAFLENNMKDIFSTILGANIDDPLLNTKLFTYLNNNENTQTIYLRNNTTTMTNIAVSINVGPIMEAINYVNNNVSGYTLGIINNNFSFSGGWVSNGTLSTAKTLLNMTNFKTLPLHDYPTYNSYRKQRSTWGKWYLVSAGAVGFGYYIGYMDTWYNETLPYFGHCYPCTTVIGGWHDTCTFFTDNNDDTHRIMVLGGPMGTSADFTLALFGKLDQTEIPQYMLVLDPNSNKHYTIDMHSTDVSFGQTWVDISNSWTPDVVGRPSIPNQTDQVICPVTFWFKPYNTSVSGYTDMVSTNPYFCYPYETENPYTKGSWQPYVLEADCIVGPLGSRGGYGDYHNHLQSHRGSLIPVKDPENARYRGQNVTDASDGYRIFIIATAPIEASQVYPSSFIFALYGDVSENYIHRVINVYDKDSCQAYAVATASLEYGHTMGWLFGALGAFMPDGYAAGDITWWKSLRYDIPINYFPFTNNGTYYISFADGPENGLPL